MRPDPVVVGTKVARFQAKATACAESGQQPAQHGDTLCSGCAGMEGCTVPVSMVPAAIRRCIQGARQPHGVSGPLYVGPQWHVGSRWCPWDPAHGASLCARSIVCSIDLPERKHEHETLVVTLARGGLHCSTVHVTPVLWRNTHTDGTQWLFWCLLSRVFKGEGQPKTHTTPRPPFISGKQGSQSRSPRPWIPGSKSATPWALVPRLSS